jgi:hypothetical protein
VEVRFLITCVSKVLKKEEKELAFLQKEKKLLQDQVKQLKAQEGYLKG